MSHILYLIMARTRQWTYPQEFRIQFEMADLWAEALGAALSQALSAAQNPPGVATDAKQGRESADLMGVNFVLSLCNDHFRLRRNAGLLMEESNGCKELRSITRALENVDELLEKNGIRCLDLTGQEYDVGRNDFESLGEPEERPGLDAMKIVRCERPAILFNSKLIQKARGIVARPA